MVSGYILRVEVYSSRVQRYRFRGRRAVNKNVITRSCFLTAK